MSAAPHEFPICPNGHRQTVASTRFCIYCGVAVGPAVHAPQPLPPPQHPQPIQYQPHQPQVPKPAVSLNSHRYTRRSINISRHQRVARAAEQDKACRLKA